jgi:hypothetical protein
VAVNARIDAGEPLGPAQRQDPPPRFPGGVGLVPQPVQNS